MLEEISIKFDDTFYYSDYISTLQLINNTSQRLREDARTFLIHAARLAATSSRRGMETEPSYGHILHFPNIKQTTIKSSS